MRTRRLTVDDWQANRTIRLEALAECPGNYFTSLAEAEARSDDQWRGMLMSATLVVFGLFDGDDLAGITAIIREHADTATLAMSYIRPAWRGQGYSALLCRARLDWARGLGVRRILVSHRASNQPSRRAIERHGFVRTGTRAHRWPDGAVEDDVSYELVLDQAA
jgi:RimJ/RimL family protein N-acetyltransferase